MKKQYLLFYAVFVCLAVSGCGGGGSDNTLTKVQYDVLEIPYAIPDEVAEFATNPAHLSDNDEVTAPYPGTSLNSFYWARGMSQVTALNNTEIVAQDSSGALLSNINLTSQPSLHGYYGATTTPTFYQHSLQNPEIFTPISLPKPNLIADHTIASVSAFGSAGEYGGQIAVSANQGSRAVIWHGPPPGSVSASSAFTEELLPLPDGLTQSYVDCGSAAGIVVHSDNKNQATVGNPLVNSQVVLWKPDGSKSILGLNYNNYSYSTGVNASGMIIGQTIDMTTHAQRAFVWTEATGLQLLPGLATDNLAQVRGVSNDGTVIGFATASNTHLVTWKNGSIHDLYNALPSPYTGIIGLAINNQGHILAQVFNENTQHYVYAILTPRH